MRAACQLAGSHKGLFLLSYCGLRRCPEVSADESAAGRRTPGRSAPCVGAVVSRAARSGDPACDGGFSPGSRETRGNRDEEVEAERGEPGIQAEYRVQMG
jgi:hypothetical protein